jgi:hypothetical protein
LTQWIKRVISIADSGTNAVIRCGGSTNRLVIEMNRNERVLTISRHGTSGFIWYCPRAPEQAGRGLKWGGKVALEFEAGKLIRIEPDAYEPLFATGFNKLKMKDPAPIKYTRVIVRPADGIVELHIRQR